MEMILLLLRRFWPAIPCLALLIALGITRHTLAGRTAQRDAAIVQAKAERDTRIENERLYRTAQAEAQRLQTANIARVEKEQAAITERTTHELETRNADTAAAYDRLRRSIPAGAGHGGADEPALSLAGTAACLAYAGTDCDALPATLKAAEDNTNQLIALQAWVRAQAAVEVGPAP